MKTIPVNRFVKKRASLLCSNKVELQNEKTANSRYVAYIPDCPFQEFFKKSLFTTTDTQPTILVQMELLHICLVKEIAVFSLRKFRTQFLWLQTMPNIAK